MEDRKLDELRVADAELQSGKTSGRTFLQYSPGAVAFLTDRPVVQARVSRLIQEQVTAPPIESKHKS